MPEDCHDLTYEEASAVSDPDPPVPCSEDHTSMTLRVLHLSDPDWDSWAVIVRRMIVPCHKELIKEAGGRTYMVQRSAYDITYFLPTKAQREAGADWVRCDVVVRAGLGNLGKVPEHMDMETTIWPSPDVRKCRQGRPSGYALTTCSRRHKFGSHWTPEIPGDEYPGKRKAEKFAYEQCYDLLGIETSGDPFLYEWVPSRRLWRAGYRHAVCLPGRE